MKRHMFFVGLRENICSKFRKLGKGRTPSGLKVKEPTRLPSCRKDENTRELRPSILLHHHTSQKCPGISQDMSEYFFGFLDLDHQAASWISWTPEGLSNQSLMKESNVSVGFFWHFSRSLSSLATIYPHPHPAWTPEHLSLLCACDFKIFQSWQWSPHKPKEHQRTLGDFSELQDHWNHPLKASRMTWIPFFHNPWRIHGAAIYGAPWIPSIYPKCQYTIHESHYSIRNPYNTPWFFFREVWKDKMFLSHRLALIVPRSSKVQDTARTCHWNIEGPPECSTDSRISVWSWWMARC